MSELKPCLQEVEALDILEAMLDVCDMKCTGPMYANDPPRSGLCRIPEEDAGILRQYIAVRRAAPVNEPLTLNELREMRREPLWKEEPPSGDMTESEIEPVLFNGIHCGNEERACWVTCEAHHANALIEHIAAGKINFYRWPPEGGRE